MSFEDKAIINLYFFKIQYIYVHIYIYTAKYIESSDSFIENTDSFITNDTLWRHCTVWVFYVVYITFTISENIIRDDVCSVLKASNRSA